ncbi:hypothetical protein JTB14_035126 [Gonioctena quinquepunctata]|nr:hypothetical protein JTB14_035126 [Gonioctena quinquepunctata]
MWFLSDILVFIQVLISLSWGYPIVKTKNGWIWGEEATTGDLGKPYYSFRGIPYAKPPVGNLRFKEPVPQDPWPGIFFATSEGNICIQENARGSEDCLYINVYVPKNVSGTPKVLPVMVWIYGGYFMSGHSAYDLYGPDYFLSEDVIFVSFNYRLGVFGFFCTGDEAAYGNWGLKDQVLALKWVQENIGFFGGDKNSVTIFGESAGAVSVSHLIQSPSAANLFDRAIMQSGSSLNLWGLTRKPKAVNLALGALLGIETQNTTLLTEELRTMGAYKLWVASTAVTVGETLITSAMRGSVFAPCKEPAHDGAVVLEPSHEILRNGNFNRVPIIIGFNSQEALVFSKVMDLVKKYVTSFNILPSELIPVDINLSDPDMVSKILYEISSKYFGDNMDNLTDDTLTQFITDDQFVRPINEAAHLMAKWVPTYYYRFSFDDEGVQHAGELPLIFSSFEYINKTDSDKLTGKRIVKLWTNFAKTGIPIPNPDPLFEDVVWEPYSENGTYFDLGLSLKMSSDMEQYNIPWWKTIFHKYGNPPFDTY